MAFYDENGYYYPQIPYDDSGYYSYYPPVPQSSAGYYEYLPTQSTSTSTSNQYEYDASYTHLGSTQYVVYHSVAAPSSPDLDFEEYDPHPYKGGYDIGQTYGKPLSPSDEICYPRSPGAAIPIARAAPTVAVTEAAPIAAKEEEEEEEEEDDDDDDDDEEEADEHLKSEVEEDAAEEHLQPGDGDGTSADSVQVFGEYNGGRVGNQIPHGYGLETFDLCENLFGYWPCLSRMKNSCDACGSEIRGADVDPWTKTADYLFGNPDPYGEWADEGGYAYHQMQYQQQPTSTLYEQAHQHGQNSWFP